MKGVKLKPNVLITTDCVLQLLSIRVFSSDGHYLNNREFLSKNYRLIVAPRKFAVLKTNICPRSEASRANMLVLIKNISKSATSARRNDVFRRNDETMASTVDQLRG